MTTKPKAQASEPAAEASSTKAEAPQCGAPHFLPSLAARVACTEPAPDPDRPPGTPEHEHRHQDGDAIYTWR